MFATNIYSTAIPVLQKYSNTLFRPFNFESKFKTYCYYFLFHQFYKFLMLFSVFEKILLRKNFAYIYLDFVPFRD